MSSLFIFEPTKSRYCNNMLKVCVPLNDAISKGNLMLLLSSVYWFEDDAKWCYLEREWNWKTTEEESMRGNFSTRTRYTKGRSVGNNSFWITHAGPIRWKTMASVCTSSGNQPCWRHPLTATSIFQWARAARHHRPIGIGGSTQICVVMLVIAITMACTFVSIVSLVFSELCNVLIKSYLSSC